MLKKGNSLLRLSRWTEFSIRVGTFSMITQDGDHQARQGNPEWRQGRKRDIPLSLLVPRPMALLTLENALSLFAISSLVHALFCYTNRDYFSHPSAVLSWV